MKKKGNLIIEKNNREDYSDLTEVSGYVEVREGATLTAPALTEVSGYVEVRGKLISPFFLKTIFLEKDYRYQSGGSLTSDGKIFIRLGCFVRTLQEWESDFWNNNAEFPNDNSEKSKKRLATFNKIKSYLTT